MGGLFGSFLTGFGTLALDAVSALINGPKPTVQPDLKDKSVRSNAYGTPWSRFRGRVRAQGKVLWATNIQTSIWKTTSGGIFGIGQKSVYYNKYSFSVFVGFGKKLGGGAAVSFLRLWADGKPLYNAVASTGTITGTVTVTVVGGGQIAGSLVLLIDLASGASVTLNPGDLISVPGDPLPYTVQQAVSATGPATSVQVQIWPPLRVDLAGGGAVTFAQNGINGAAPWDLSSFDPNPHDGSHPAGGYLAPPGGAAFYLGSSTQGKDPTMVNHLGAANVSAYRGMTGVCLHDLQLANYGDHQPQITGELAFDVASPLFPLNGPIANVNLVTSSLGAESIALPFSGNEAIQWTNPFTQRLPYIWVFSATGQDATHDGTIYRINTQTNQLEASYLVPRIGTFRLTGAGMIADQDGFLYYVQNNATLTKLDGMTFQIVAQWGPPNPGGFAGNVLTLYAYDTQQSLFGNPVVLKLLFGGGQMFDRNTLLPIGTPNNLSSQNVVTGFDSNGNAIITAGNPLSAFGDVGNTKITDDGSGNVWVLSGSTLYECNCQFSSTVVLNLNNVPVQELAIPSFALTSTNVSSITNGGVNGSIQFYPGDNTIVVFGLNRMGKVSVSTNAIVGSVVSSSLINESKIGQTYDPMGGMLVSGGPGFIRVDLGSLSIIGSGYAPSNWVTPAGGQAPGYVYDPYTDSIWFDGLNNGGTFGGLNQALLDRGTGSGIGIDQLVSSLLLECGYTSSQFDVTSLAASGQTFGGWECERKTYKESLQEMMRHFLFDVAEIDGKLVCLMRGQASAVTIPESDLGALDDPSKYEPRLTETIQDERDLPLVVTVKYYDFLKDDQMAAQETRRISQPYASSLVSAVSNLTTRNQLDIVSPLFEYAAPVKQQTDRIIWDLVAGRFGRKAKLGTKYIRLDPTDVVTFSYKTLSLITRLTEADLGSTFAREITGVSQDSSVYTSAIPTSATSPGTGGGVLPTPPAKSHGNYTISPVAPLSSPNSTTIDLAAFTATFDDGLRTNYAARTFSVPDPGAGHTQIYYVTIADPNFTGDQPVGTPSLTAYDQTTAAAAFVGQYSYIYAGAILVVGGGAVGIPVGQGGQPSPSSGLSQIVVEVPTGSINSSNQTFGLSKTPAEMYAMVWNGQLRFDFSLNGQTVTTSFTPDTNDSLFAVYFI